MFLKAWDKKKLIWQICVELLKFYLVLTLQWQKWILMYGKSLLVVAFLKTRSTGKKNLDDFARIGQLSILFMIWMPEFSKCFINFMVLSAPTWFWIGVKWRLLVEYCIHKIIIVWRNIPKLKSANQWRIFYSNIFWLPGFSSWVVSYTAHSIYLIWRDFILECCMAC